MTIIRTLILNTLSVILMLGLHGCATEALNRAPEAADKPWKVKGQDSQIMQNGSAQDFSVPSNPDLALIATPVQVDTNREYDLAQLIDLAQRSNPLTKNAWEKARQAALAVGMVEATMLPIITANVIGGQQKTKTPVEIPLIGSRNIDTTLKGVTPNIALQWLVFDFGQRAALADAAKQVSFAANVTFNAIHQKVIFDVARTYYEYTAAVAGYRIAGQTLKNSKSVLNAVQAKVNAGTATTVELALARQQVAQAELRIVTAKGQQQSTYHGLLASMGVNATLSIKVNASIKRKLPATFDEVTQNVLETALSRRADVIASYAALQASKSGIVAAEAGFMPKVFIAGALGTSSNSFNVGHLPSVSNQTTGTGIIVGATMPIYDSGLRAAQIKNAQSTHAAASETFRKIQLDAIAEIVLASNVLKTALAANKAAGVLVETSNTAFDAAFESYKNGLGTVTLVNEANNALLNARLAQTDAEAGARIAAANLAFFTGALTSSDSLAGVSTQH